MGLKNKDGVDIKDVWRDGIRTYLGMTFNGFPNCFMVYTPHGTAMSAPLGDLMLTCLQLQQHYRTVLLSSKRKPTSSSPRSKSSSRKAPEASNQTRDAEDEWDHMIDLMNKHTLFPLTNSWWNRATIEGNRAQVLTHPGGIQMYEGQCRATLKDWKGFTVVHGNAIQDDDYRAAKKLKFTTTTNGHAEVNGGAVAPV